VLQLSGRYRFFVATPVRESRVTDIQRNVFHLRLVLSHYTAASWREIVGSRSSVIPKLSDF
jgi:hypothetical protein